MRVINGERHFIERRFPTRGSGTQGSSISQDSESLLVVLFVSSYIVSINPGHYFSASRGGSAKHFGEDYRQGCNRILPVCDHLHSLAACVAGTRFTHGFSWEFHFCPGAWWLGLR